MVVNGFATKGVSLRSTDPLVHFQRRGVAQGHAFDGQCRLLLRALGFFAVTDKPFRVVSVGIEVDAEAHTRTGTTIWFEFKGSWIGSRPGLRRTDSVKKAVASGCLLRASPVPYPDLVVMTTHRPVRGSAGERMLQLALTSAAIADVVCVNDPSDMRRLHGLADS